MIKNCKKCNEPISFGMEDLIDNMIPNIKMKSTSKAVKDRIFDICDDCKV